MGEAVLDALTVVGIFTLFVIVGIRLGIWIASRGTDADEEIRRWLP